MTISPTGINSGIGIDMDTGAAKRFYALIRVFSIRTKPWQPAIWYETKPDEEWDATLVSSRVYGRNDEFLTVMAAAGVDGIDQPIPQMKLCLPTEAQLYFFKGSANFESRASMRNNFEPGY